MRTKRTHVYRAISSYRYCSNIRDHFCSVLSVLTNINTNQRRKPIRDNSNKVVLLLTLAITTRSERVLILNELFVRFELCLCDKCIFYYPSIWPWCNQDWSWSRNTRNHHRWPWRESLLGHNVTVEIILCNICTPGNEFLIKIYKNLVVLIL